MDTPHIEIIGNSNENCHFLENNVLTAIAKLGIAANVNCITDPEEVQRRRLGGTPALVINGKVISQGNNVSSRQIQAILQESTYALQHRDFLNRFRG